MRIEDKENLYEEISTDIDNISTVYFKLTEKEPVRKYEILHVIERARVACEHILEHLENTDSFAQQVSEDFHLGLVGRSEQYPEVETPVVEVSEDDSSRVEVDPTIRQESNETESSGLEREEDQEHNETLIYTELPKLDYSLGKKRPPKPEQEKIDQIKQEKEEDIEFSEEGELPKGKVKKFLSLLKNK